MTVKRAMILLLAVVAFVLLVVYAPLSQWITDIILWMQSNPGVGELVYAGLIAGAILSMMPTFLLMVAGGFLFGLWKGILLTWLAYQVAAVLTFWIGRTIARGWIEKRIEGNPRFKTLDQAIHGSGFNIVLLVRLAIIVPYNILNYAFGLTKVYLRDYALGTALGSVPMIGLYVFVGTTVTNLRNLTSQAEDFAGDWRVILTEVTVVVIVLLVLIRFASRALARELESDTPDQ